MNSDYVLLTEKETMWAKLLEQVLSDNGVPYVSLPVYGAGLSLKAGVQERWRICVPGDVREQAQELLHELFPEDEEQDVL